MMASNDSLIIFTKNPVKGKVKTRLAKTMGDDEALKIYLALIHHTLHITLPVSCNKTVYYSDYIDHEDLWSKAGYGQVLQQGNNLGQRMYHAFKNEFSKGYKSVCIIGCDCPGINSAILIHAFHILRTTAVIIGPATDGGYYLLGMQYLQKKIFERKAWNGNRVLIDTVKNLNDDGVTFQLLPELSDIDEEKDIVSTHFNMNKV